MCKDPFWIKHSQGLTSRLIWRLNLGNVRSSILGTIPAMIASRTNYIPNAKNPNGSRKKVFVGVSGGVDSSVSLALLRDKGFDVTGVFIKVYHPDFLGCSWRDERLDAMAVCQKLGVPFLDLDLEKEYKQDVFDYMIEGYREGETPNPDVFCNKYVKFGGFLEFALDNGADYVATGHYAQNWREPVSVSSKKRSLYSTYISHFFSSLPWLASNFGHSKRKYMHKMLKGSDDNKDQTYFLYQMPQEKLQKVLFPIGHLPKSKVRKIAQKYGLLTADKKDSQGLCFVGDVNMKDFLQQYIDKKPGDVLNANGKVIGSHDGAIFYTIGERHGYTIFPKAKTPNMPRLFVAERDIANNTITVGPKSDLEKKNKLGGLSITIRSAHWVSGHPKEDQVYQGRVRYRGMLIDGTLEKKEEHWVMNFTEPHSSVAAGQSLVIYQGEQCVGGGIMV